jgi:hypothetical protein
MENTQMVNESFEKFFYDLINNIFDKILNKISSIAADLKNPLQEMYSCRRGKLRLTGVNCSDPFLLSFSFFGKKIL